MKSNYEQEDSMAQRKGGGWLPIPKPISSNIIGFISTASHAIPAASQPYPTALI